jgi:hypothetical protein
MSQQVQQECDYRTSCAFCAKLFLRLFTGLFLIRDNLLKGQPAPLMHSMRQSSALMTTLGSELWTVEC